MRAMDDIVEKFLMEKLEKEIKDASETAQNLEKEYKCKKFPVHKEWEELQNLMKRPETPKDTIREKLYYLLNLTAEWREQLNKQQLLTPRALLPVDDISVRLKKVKKDLEESHKGGHIEQEQPPSLTPKNPQVYRWSCQANLTKIHGFDDKSMIMERLLLNEGNKAIGIVGVAGVGKTALAQLAYNHQRVQEHFLLRIWLCLSKQQNIDDPGLGDQVKRMLRCLGFEDQVIEKAGRSKGGEKKLQVALRHQLNRGRYLIVLDDVWRKQEKEKKAEKEDDLDMELFSFLMQHPSRYQRTLIVTSRSPELEKMVGTKNMHRLLPLEDDDSCWKIFSDAFKGDKIATSADEEMGKLKPDIVGKCEGLPLMAKMLGKIAHLQP